MHIDLQNIWLTTEEEMIIQHSIQALQGTWSFQWKTYILNGGLIVQIAWWHCCTFHVGSRENTVKWEMIDTEVELETSDWPESTSSRLDMLLISFQPLTPCNTVPVRPRASSKTLKLPVYHSTQNRLGCRGRQCSGLLDSQKHILSYFKAYFL